MIRPLLADQEDSRRLLLQYMADLEYPYTTAHKDILENALVFECVKGDDLAGFLWFYRLYGEETVYAIHAMVLPKYRKRFFSRTLVNAISGALFCLGATKVRAENSYQDFIERLSGKRYEDYVDLDLPFTWR